MTLAQPMVEIDPEASLGELLIQWLVGGGDQPEFARLFLRTSQGAIAATLQNAQQFGLHGQWHITYFIQKQGSAVSLSQQAGLWCRCSRKSAFLKTEELAFEEILRNGGAVDGDEGRVLAWR